MDSHCTILLAHGSPDPVWRKTFQILAGPALDANDAARLAFMESASPSLEETVHALTRDGITRISVLPLFLARGRHLRRDLPQMIEELQSRYPVRIELLPPIGEHPILAAALEQIIAETLSREEPRDD